MADTTLRMVVEGDTQDAEQALARTADAADDAGARVDDAGSRMDRGLSTASTAMGEAEDKAEGFAYMLSGAAGVGIGFSQIMQGDVFAGTVMAAMGVADLAQGISKFAIPAIKAMTVENIKATAAKVKDTAAAAAHKVATLASAAATTVWTAATKGLNAAWKANPIGIVITVVMLLVAAIIYAYKHSETFRNIVDAGLKVVAAAFKFLWDGAKAALDWIGTALETVGGKIKGFFVAAFRFAINAVLTYLGWIVNGAAAAFGWIPGLGPKLQTAATEFNKFKDNVNRSLDGIDDETVTVNVRTVYSGGTQYSQKVSVGGRGGRAKGGPVQAGGMYIVGEEGPEILDLTGAGAGGYVHSNKDSQAMLRSVGGGGDHYHVHAGAIVTSDRQLVRLFDEARSRLARSGAYVPA